MEKKYVPKPNTCTLWPYDYKKSDNHPDIRGDMFIERGFLKLLMEKHSDQDGKVKVNISGWRKTINGKDCVYVSLSEPFVKRAPEPAPEVNQDDEDIPF